MYAQSAMVNEDPVVDDGAETAGGSDICPLCEERPAETTVDHDAYCRKCADELLFKTPIDAWEELRDLEEAEAEDVEPDVDEDALYHPPFPGHHGYSRFSRAKAKSGSGYKMNLTRPVRVAPTEAGEQVQIYTDLSPTGIPVLDLYYIDEDEDAESLPQVRQIIDDGNGLLVNLPGQALEKLLHKHVGVPITEYDPEDNPLMFWPQAMPDRIRLYAVAFEEEWEQMRDEVEASTPTSPESEPDSEPDSEPEAEPESEPEADSDEDMDSEQDSEAEPTTETEADTATESDQVRLDELDDGETQATEASDLVISEETVDQVATGAGLDKDALVDALAKMQAGLDEDWVREQGVKEPASTDDRTIYILESSTWDAYENFGLEGVPIELKQAVRYVHNTEARALADDADRNFRGELAAYEAVVVNRSA